MQRSKTMSLNGKKLADELHVETLQFVIPKTVHNQMMSVTYTPSTRMLNINRKAVQVLELEKWTNVVLGYEPRSKIIVLKNVDATEPGAVTVLRVKCTKAGHQAKETGGVKVNVQYLFTRFGLGTQRQIFRPERNGDLLLLKAVAE